MDMIMDVQMVLTVGNYSQSLILHSYLRHSMYYTLSQLRDAINQKIVEQGESAPVAAFIFTRDDVVTLDENCNETTYSDGVVQEVLIAVGGSDYIYTEVHDRIYDEIQEVLEQTTPNVTVQELTQTGTQNTLECLYTKQVNHQHLMSSLNNLQFEQFVCNYVQHIIDGLDPDSMESMLVDLLTREYETYTEWELVGQIQSVYGVEVADEMYGSVGGVPFT